MLGKTPEEKRADRVTQVMEKLPKVLEDSITKGFSKVIETIKTTSKEEGSKDRDQEQKNFDIRTREEKRRADVDRASALRQNIEDRVREGKMIKGTQQRVYFFLDDVRMKTAEHHAKMNSSFKEAFDDFSTMVKGNLSEIISQFTGPFYGLIKGTFGMLIPSVSKIFSPLVGVAKTAGTKLSTKAGNFFDKFKIQRLTDWLGNKILRPTRLPVPYEEPKTPFGEGKTRVFVKSTDAILLRIHKSMIDGQTALRFMMGTVADLVSYNTEDIVNAIYETSGGGAGGAGGGFRNALTVIPGERRGTSLAVKVQMKTLEFQVFVKEQFLEINDHLKKMAGDAKGSGLVSALGSIFGGLMRGVSALITGAGALLKFAGPLLKRFLTTRMSPVGAVGAGLMAAGISGYNAYQESREKGMSKGMAGANALARGAISGAGATLGGLFGGPSGAMLGGLIGDQIGKLANLIGDNLGLALFDAQQWVGNKFNTFTEKLGVGIFNTQQKIVKVFTDLHKWFGSTVSLVKDTISSFIPSGTTIVEALKEVLLSIVNAGTAAANYARQQAQRIGESAVKAGRQAGEVGRKAYEGVKGLFQLGGKDWKATTQGMSPTMMKNFEAMAADYKKQTGKTLTMTEGYRTKEQQEYLQKHGKYMVAKPGMSLHQHGAAIDIDKQQARELERSGLLAKHGFVRPYGEKDPMHIELAKYATPQERAKIRKRGGIEEEDRVPAAAVGAYVSRAGLAQVHPAEIISPVSRFTEMLSKTAANIARPSVIETKAGKFDSEAMGHLSVIAAGIGKLIEKVSSEGASSPIPSPAVVPDMPGDMSLLLGNYFPTRGGQWR